MGRCIVFVCLILFCTFLQAIENWPRFRGNNGDGSAVCNIPSIWKKNNFRWILPLEENGHGSPSVWKDKVFLNASKDRGKTRKVICVNARSGKEEWIRSYPSKTHKAHRFNSFASSTPALDANRVYSVWGHATQLMVTAHSHSGKLIWEKDLGGVNGGHGFAVSPIVFEDLLIVPNDQEKGGGAHFGLDSKTGEIRWKVPRKSKRLTYSTPCIFTSPKGQSEVIFTNWWLGFTSLEPLTGKKLWELSVFGRPHSERAISSPIVASDLVLGVCGFTTLDKVLVAIRPASVPKMEKLRRFGYWMKPCPTSLLHCSQVTDSI